MKIKLWSDLHLEFNPFYFEGSVEDLTETTLVLAGDIGMNKASFYSFLQYCSEDFKYVIYVIGNHECYGTTEAHMLKLIRESTKEYDNFFVLHNEAIMLDGVKFIGSPLYANTEFQPQYIRDIKYGIADYMRISIEGDDGLRFLNPHDTYKAHQKAMIFIESELQLDQGYEAHAGQKENTVKTVVVTHWNPTHLLTDKKYVGSPLQNYFCNNDEYLMQYYEIDLWLFGHTHQVLDVQDERFYGTRVVSNARGYGNYVENKFDKDKVIVV